MIVAANLIGVKFSRCCFVRETRDKKERKLDRCLLAIETDDNYAQRSIDRSSTCTRNAQPGEDLDKFSGN